MKYRPEIDGLRSIAVMPVILFHGGLDLFSGGFVGVDVFFVISGYLITTIVLSELEDGRFSLLNFYSRRARRILPALFFVVACTFPFAWVLMLPTEFKDFAQSIAAVSIFSSNFLFWIESGYFAAAAELKPLLHTWSLAVEEQYYIFFPLLLMLFWRRNAKATTLLLFAIFLASLFISELLWRSAPDANFYLLPSRIWELMVGSFCAIFTLKRGPQCSHPLSIIGLLLILVSIFVYDSETPFPSVYALVPVIGTGMVLLFATKGTWVARVLSTPIPVGIGLISYSAYLWHQPLFALVRLRAPAEPPLILMMSLAALSLVLAYFSWRFVEKPARHISWSAFKVVASTTLASASIFVISAGLSVTDLHRTYFENSLSPQNRDLLTRVTRMQTMEHGKPDDEGDCRFYTERFDTNMRDRFDDCFAQHDKAVVIFGDSHSIDVFNGFRANSDRPFIVGLGQGACRPHVVGANCETSGMPLFLEEAADKIDHAFYAQAGFWLLSDPTGTHQARRIFAAGTEEVHAVLNDAAIERVTVFLERMNTLFPVTWLGPRIEPHVDMDTMLRIDCDQAPELLQLRPSHLDAFEQLDVRLTQVLSAAGLSYLSEIQTMEFDITRDLYSCDALYWSDGDHWSPQGERTFGARLEPEMTAVLENTRQGISTND